MSGGLHAGPTSRIEFRLVELPEYGDHYYAVVSFQVELLTGRLLGYGPLWRHDEWGLCRLAVLEVCLNRKSEAKWPVVKAEAEFYDKLLPILSDIVVEHDHVRKAKFESIKKTFNELNENPARAGMEPLDTSDSKINECVDTFPAIAGIGRIEAFFAHYKKHGAEIPKPGLSKAEKRLADYFEVMPKNAGATLAEAHGEYRWLETVNWDLKNLPPLDEVPKMCWRFDFKRKPGFEKKEATKRALLLLEAHWDKSPYIPLLGNSPISPAQLKRLESYDNKKFKALTLDQIAEILTIETGQTFTPNYMSTLRRRIGLQKPDKMPGE